MAVIASQSSGGTPNISAVSGHSLTWTAVAAAQQYGSRRSIRVFRAANTGSDTSGTLSITVSASAGSLQEIKWSVDTFSGIDTTTPNDTPVTAQTGAFQTSHALGDVGTPGVGDAVYCAFGFEDGGDSFALGAAFTQLGSTVGGSNSRSLKTGWDSSAPLDETPDCSWSTSNNACGGVGFILNAAAASGIYGTLSKTLGAVTLSASGQVVIAGAAAQTLGALSLSSAGSLAVTGSVGVTFAPATLSAAGGLEVAGSLAATLADLTAAGVGALSLAVAVDVALEDVAVSGAGVVANSGALASTLEDAALSASGAVAISGSLSATLADAAVSAAAGPAIDGALTAALGDVSLFSEGAVAAGQGGALAATMEDASVAASGVVVLSAAVDASLDDAAVSADGAVALSGALAAALDGVGLSASGALTDGPSGALTATLDNVTAVAAGKVAIVADVDAMLAGVMLAGGSTLTISGSVATALEAVTLAAYGQEVAPDEIGGALDVMLADLVVSGALWRRRRPTRGGGGRPAAVQTGARVQAASRSRPPALSTRRRPHLP
ncbi:MAG TPA: hypothetical protein PKA33_01675 [Amaricoccus sp.]|nr:hypothetical protein [Micropruina sp.]HMR23472.1 hypothetical protein [Micropruina sp.]HMT98056.1 hypothetical protein [Amaricoccus sp.]